MGLILTIREFMSINFNTLHLMLAIRGTQKFALTVTEKMYAPC